MDNTDKVVLGLEDNYNHIPIEVIKEFVERSQGITLRGEMGHPNLRGNIDRVFAIDEERVCISIQDIEIQNGVIKGWVKPSGPMGILVDSTRIPLLGMRCIKSRPDHILKIITFDLVGYRD